MAPQALHLPINSPIVLHRLWHLQLAYLRALHSCVGNLCYRSSISGTSCWSTFSQAQRYGGDLVHLVHNVLILEVRSSTARLVPPAIRHRSIPACSSVQALGQLHLVWRSPSGQYSHYIRELHRTCIHEVVYVALAHSSGITFLGRPTLLGKVRTIGNLGHHGVPDPLSVPWCRHSNDPVIDYVGSASLGWLWLPFGGRWF